MCKSAQRKKCRIREDFFCVFLLLFLVANLKSYERRLDAVFMLCAAADQVTYFSAAVLVLIAITTSSPQDFKTVHNKSLPDSYSERN